MNRKPGLSPINNVVPVNIPKNKVLQVKNKDKKDIYLLYLLRIHNTLGNDH